jgi:thiol:disulfide interchange protein
VASQISAPVRIVALIGVLCAVAMGTWMTLSSAGKGGPAEVAGATPLSAEAQANAVAAKLNNHNLKTAVGKPDTAAPAAAATAAKPKVKAAATPVAQPVKKAVATPAPKPRAAPKAKPVAATLPDGTPHTIAGLLGTHQVVIVLLYNPNAKVDSYSLGEAALGAQQAGAGFLRVNVLDQAQALPFSKAYGVLQDPTLLFFVRPGKRVNKLVGFADHETISQAAANAALQLGASS